jgi:CelD/BcsL family acetyltransferase involved in cellulose biosynthesis
LNIASLRYEIITDLTAAKQVVPAWNTLLDLSPCNRTFSSPIWFFASCEVQPELLPWLALAWRGDSLVGVLPLALQPKNREAIFPNAMSNYNDVIAADGDMTVAAGLLEHAVSGAERLRRLELKWIREDSNLRAGLSLLDGRRQLTARYFPEREYLSIALLPTRAEYLATRSRVFRKGVSRVMRKATENGLSVHELTPADFPPESLPELFFDLHFSRFGEQSAFFRSGPNALFAKLALPDLFAQRRLQAFAVSQHERVVALDLSFRGARSLCTWNGGYALEAECWSPGRLLLLEGIQRACELGLEEYDLLRGNQPWKASWANQTRRVGKVVVEA